MIAEDPPDSGPDRSIKHGETYTHEKHGRVEVEGIWRGVSEVDSAHNTAENGTIIIRYSCENGPAELIDTLDEFLDATEESE